jgi:hypothetical protein
MLGRDKQIEWYKRARRRERKQAAFAKATIARLEGIIAHSYQDDIKIKPQFYLAPWQLPRVRTPGRRGFSDKWPNYLYPRGLPIGSDGGNTTTVTVQKDGSLACTGLPKGSTFDWT